MEKRSKKGLSFDDPAMILCSRSIISELLIQSSNVYQVKGEKEQLVIGPVIGLLLGEQQYYYHDEFMGEYADALSSYKKVGGLVYGFKSCSIDWDHECIYGLYFNQENQKWEYGCFPIPDVVYRRAYNISSITVEKLKKATDGKVFNSRRFSKWQLYRELKKNKELLDYLPETINLKSISDIEHALEKYSKIILKPTGLSRGRGICIVQKKDKDTVYIYDYQDGTKSTQHTVTLEEALHYFDLLQFTEKKYIIQPYLELAKINGAPWDIRVVMQKDQNFKWKCHGIECRVAGTGDLITNISRGGRALPISKAVKLSFGPMFRSSKVKKDIIQICRVLCETIEKEDDIFAELGIDIAMDVDQNYWIIESNVRPTYNGFKKHMDYDNYLYLSSGPIIFASSLAGFKKGGK